MARPSGPDDAFVTRYRNRLHLEYLPPPDWVCGAPVCLRRPDMAIFSNDEMGKTNVRPVVFADEPDSVIVERALRVAAGAHLSARLELRTVGDCAARQVALKSGFTVDRVQTGMHALIRMPRGAPPSSADVISGVPSSAGELRDLYNCCFGLALSALDIERMRSHPAWDERGFFQVRDGGQMIATFRLIIDSDAKGRHYGFLRGLAIHPSYRQESLHIMFALYQAAAKRLNNLGVQDCYLLADRATEQNGTLLRGLFNSLGFAEEESVYRLRESFAGAALVTLRQG